MDAPSPTAWDDLELEVKGVPEGDHLTLRFRFDPKGPAPHATCRALPLRRDEELETQVVRHLEQQRASPGVWELRLCVNNKFRAQRLVRVEFPPPQATTEPVATPGGVTLTGPLTSDELVKHVRQQIEDAEQLKMALGLVPGEEDEDNDDDDEEEASAPPPEPLWVQAVKSEKADLLFAKLGTFLDGWLDSKLEEQRAKTSVARARAEQMGATPAPQRDEGPPKVRLHSVNGEPPKKVES